MPLALMDEADRMQEQMGNVGREMEILRKNQKEILDNRKNHKGNFKMPSTGLLIDWTQLRKVSMGQRVYQQTSQKQKSKKEQMTAKYRSVKLLQKVQHI